MDNKDTTSWTDGYRVGKLEAFVEVMKLMDEHIYGPYHSVQHRRTSRRLRSEFEVQFETLYELVCNE